MNVGTSEKVGTGNQEDELWHLRKLESNFVSSNQRILKAKSECNTHIKYTKFELTIDVSSAQWSNLESPNVTEHNIENMKNTRMN